MKSERTFRRPILAVGLAACLFIASCGRDNRPPSEQLISIGSHRLEMRLAGKGTPVVVIEAGITDGLDKLTPLQDRLAQETQVIIYNRAGYGRSEAGPLPRHAGREAEELKALLDTASGQGPYVLVGHSLGALNMQLFASRYPADVAGLVLLDPPPLSFILGRDYQDLSGMAEKMTAEWQAIADSSANSADAQEQARSAFFRMIASEHREMFGETASLVAAISTFGDLPLVVLAAGKPNPAFGEVAEEYQRYWVGQSRLLAGKSTQGKFVLAEGASHYIYLDVPELAAQNILSVVDEVRAKTPGRAQISPDKAGAGATKKYLECFETVWQTVNDRFFDPTFGGLDWKEVRARYKLQIAAARSDEAFYTLVNEMVFKLGVSHIGVGELLTPVRVRAYDKFDWGSIQIGPGKKGDTDAALLSDGTWTSPVIGDLGRFRRRADFAGASAG